MDNIIKTSVIAWYRTDTYVELLTYQNSVVKLFGSLGDLFEIISLNTNEENIYKLASSFMSYEKIKQSLVDLHSNGFIKIWSADNLFNSIFS